MVLSVLGVDSDVDVDDGFTLSDLLGLAEDPDADQLEVELQVSKN